MFKIIILFAGFFFFTYGWNLTVTHNLTLQTPHRVIRIMHHSPTLRHIPATAVCIRTLAE